MRLIGVAVLVGEASGPFAPESTGRGVALGEPGGVGPDCGGAGIPVGVELAGQLNVGGVGVRGGIIGAADALAAAWNGLLKPLSLPGDWPGGIGGAGGPNGFVCAGNPIDGPP